MLNVRPGHRVLADIMNSNRPRPISAAQNDNPAPPYQEGYQALQRARSALSSVHSNLSAICEFWRETSNHFQYFVDRASIEPWKATSLSSTWEEYQEVLAECIASLDPSESAAPEPEPIMSPVMDEPVPRVQSWSSEWRHSEPNVRDSDWRRSDWRKSDRRGSRWSTISVQPDVDHSMSSLPLLYFLIASIAVVTIATKYLAEQSKVIDYNHW